MNNANKTVSVECFKCLGRGRFDNWSHVAGGVCFQCAGSGTLAFDAKAMERGGPSGTKRERMIRYLAARIEEAKRAEDRAAWVELWSTDRDYPRLIDTLRDCYRTGMSDVADRAILALSKLGITPIDLGAT